MPCLQLITGSVHCHWLKVNTVVIGRSCSIAENRMCFYLTASAVVASALA